MEGDLASPEARSRAKDPPGGGDAGTPPPGDPARAPPARRVIEALARLQLTRPVAMLAVALATLALAGLATSRLTLRTGFGELLPQSRESVIVANQVAERLVSASTLIVVLEGKDVLPLKRCVDALVPELVALGPDIIGHVDAGPRETLEFYRRHLFLFAPLDQVESVHQEVLERYQAEVARRTGADLGLDEGDAEETAPGARPAGLSLEAVRERIRRAEESLAARADPDGYYVDAKARRVAVVLRTAVPFGDLVAGHHLLSRVKDAVARVDPRRFDPAARVRYTGNFIIALEEYTQIKEDLGQVGLAGLLMILGIVFLFYLRLRPVLALAFAAGLGVVWTFGFAYLAIGHLNSSTGFLVSIVAGNGINFGIIFMARYFEERRVAGVDASLRAAHAGTWVATLAAAGAAAVAYGSLLVTEFRGFKHFGLIGGAGMILCWVATYLFLPPVLVLSERLVPLRGESPLASRLRGGFGVPFASLVERAPRAIAAVGAALGVVSLLVAVRYVANDPMEYDLRNTRNVPPREGLGAVELNQELERVVGKQGQEGVAVLVDRPEQVLPLRRALEARRDAAPAELRPFERVVTLFDLLPADQERKLLLIAEIRDRLERARRRGMLGDEAWKDVERLLPASGLRPLDVNDLPEQVARPFSEKDGTRGRLVYVVPTAGRETWEADYLIRWADSFRLTTLPDGSTVHGSGRPVLFADMLLTVIDDAPRAITVSLLGTVAVIVAAFRARRAALVVVATLLLGIAWMVSFMALYPRLVSGPGLLPRVELAGMKLNFLNFVALPISIGIGADYAVNVMQRHRLAGPGRIRDVVRQTGGAVTLCSLTTTLGYLALTLSINRAIVSFGVAAAAGEICCLLAAVLVLPAWLRSRELSPVRSPPGAPAGGA